MSKEEVCNINKEVEIYPDKLYPSNASVVQCNYCDDTGLINNTTCCTCMYT